MQKPTLRFGELNIPIAIIEALQQDRLVVFVGAGVSMGAPTNLMNFEDLTQLIITGHKAQSPSSLSNQIQHLNIDADLKKQLIDATWKAQYRAPEERLGEAQDSGKIDIKAQCLHHLKDSDLEPNHLHHQIIRLFAHNPVRIITTNFERMLQKAAQLQNKTIKTTSIAPNLPQGDVVEGIVHLHGSLEDKESIILSDRDFGRAYLTEGWARRFITGVFSQYTVLFIGYSYNDTIMKYLARSTSQNTTQKLFGISSVTAENQEAEARRWELLGMTHIPYFVSQEHGHQALNTGIEALADCLNWSFSEQQAHIQQLVQDIEGRPENLSDTAWQYLHYLYSKPELLRYFLLQIQHPAWPNILEQLQNKYPQSKILLQENTAFVLLDRFWYQSAPTMMRLFQKYYAKPISARTLLRTIDQSLEKNDVTVDIQFVQCWLHLLTPHIDIAEYNHIFLIEPASKHIAPFLLKHNCHQELEALFRQLLLLHVRFDSSSSEKTTLQYNIDEHSLECLLHPNSSFMQLPATTILDICVQALKQHSYLLDIFSIPNQNRYDSSIVIQFYKPCIWQQIDEYPEFLQAMAYQLVDACYQVLMRPEMSTEQTWAWANEYLPQKNVLLQKLALYTIAHHPAYTADEKFTLVTNTLDMHALDFHAEIFDFFKHCLMNLSDDNIELVIESLNDYPNQDNGHCEQWAFWLKQCHATDSAIDAYYQQQKQLHPHYQLSDNPYLHIFIGEASVISPRSPYPSEQLLAQQDAAWFDELLTYNQQSWDGSEPDTEGLWREIIQACQQNPTWAMAFIQHAIDTQNNTKKLHQVISGFAQWQFTDLKQWDACFKYFQTLPIKQYSNLLCNLIDQTHRNAFFKNQSESTTQPNRLVSTLLQEQAIDSQSGFSSTYYAFGEHANVYNSNIGYVISYLIMAFEKSIQTENIHNQTQSFSAIKSSLKNDNSGHVIHLLMAQYGFFEHHQPDFAHEKLLPYLNTTHPQHLLAWSGFLMNNQLTVHTYGLIETDLKTLLQSHKPQDNLLSDFDKRCLNLYLWSISLNYHSNATDSINWFLKLASAPLSKNLTKILTDILKAKYSDTNSRRWEAIPDWMVQYWQQRDHGVGGKLDASEYECLWMLSVNCPDWIPQIYEFLMQSDNLNAHSSWLLLIREKQEQLKPQDITQWAQLLNQYLKLQPNFYHINGKCLDFISFILKQDIEETIKQSIHDTLNRNGIDVKEFDLK